MQANKQRKSSRTVTRAGAIWQNRTRNHKIGLYGRRQSSAGMLLKQIQDLQLKLSVDAVGNVFLRREGKNTDLAPVAMGSHIDTVVQGGAYDGTVGVVGALEVLYMLQDEELERPIEVIIFRAEESSVLALLPSAVN